MERENTNTIKLQAWINDTCLDAIIQQDIESALQKMTSIPPVDRDLKVIEHVEIPESADFAYNMLYNCKTDYTDQQFSDRRYFDINPESATSIPRLGDCFKYV